MSIIAAMIMMVVAFFAGAIASERSANESIRRVLIRQVGPMLEQYDIQDLEISENKGISICVDGVVASEIEKRRIEDDIRRAYSNHLVMTFLTVEVPDADDSANDPVSDTLDAQEKPPVS